MTAKTVTSKTVYSPNLLYLILFLEGASVMFVELAGARMITPYYGSSLTTWASVLGISMLSLALGYLFGGKWADKSKSTSDFLMFMLFLASLSMMLMPFWAQSTMFSFVESSPKLAVVLLSIFLLFPPLFIFGSVPQTIIKLFSETKDESGRMAGSSFAISTVGGILGTLITGFLIIPNYGITKPIFAISMLIFLFPLYFLMVKKAKFFILLYVPVMFIVVNKYQKSQKFNSSIIVQSYEEGLLGQILVADIPYSPQPGVNSYNRMLMVNRMPETTVDIQTFEPTYSEYIPLLMKALDPVPDGGDALLLGLGGGNIIKQFQKRNFVIDACEFDERISEAAYKYFNLNKNFNLYTDDARHFLRKLDKKYDVIMFDLFKGENPPAYILSKENLEQIEPFLKPGGIIAVNFNGFISGETGKGTRSVLKTMLQTEFYVKVFSTKAEEAFRNTVFILSKTDINYATVPPSKYYFGRLNDGTIISDLSYYQHDISKIDTSNAYVLVDDKPILDILNEEAANSWRYYYNYYYTNLFVKQGIPMFK
jgi:spermidine synthase